ncbi:hypothetical protein [Thalassotalea ganghwensis]
MSFLIKTGLTLYRLAAITLVILPVTINLINQGSLIYSLLYLPVIMLTLSAVLVWLDRILIKNFRKLLLLPNKSKACRFCKSTQTSLR